MKTTTISTRTTRAALQAVLLALPLLALAQSRSIAGTWSSNWGPVNIKQSKIKNSKKLSITGKWEQAYGMFGQITRGTFDPATGKVEFSFFQPWDKQHGSSSLLLSKDGKTLDGTWKHSWNNGTWTMKRK